MFTLNIYRTKVEMINASNAEIARADYRPNANARASASTGKMPMQRFCTSTTKLAGPNNVKVARIRRGLASCVFRVSLCYWESASGQLRVLVLVLHHFNRQNANADNC